MLDIFNDDVFSLTSLTAAINEMQYKPGRLGQLGLFQESGINTITAVVESINGELRLLPSSERGAPATQAIGDKRQLRSFVIPHIPHDSTVLAAEVQNVRQFGSEDALQGVQAVINGRLLKMNANHEVTLEFLRMGMRSRVRSWMAMAAPFFTTCLMSLVSLSSPMISNSAARPRMFVLRA